MASIQQKLSKLIKQSFNKAKAIPLNPSKSLKQCKLTNHKAEKTLDELKLKLDQFKQIKYNSKSKMNLMNLEINREGLKKYQNKTTINSNSPLMDNSLQICKEAKASCPDKTFLDMNIKEMFNRKPLTNPHGKFKSITFISPVINPKKYILLDYETLSTYKPLYRSRNINNNENNDRRFETINEHQQDYNHNRIKTQINLFVKQINLNCNTRNKRNPYHRKNHTSTSIEQKINTTQSLMNDNTKSLNNNLNSNTIIAGMNQDYYSNATANKNNLLIDVLDSITLSNSARNRIYKTHANSDSCCMNTHKKKKSLKITKQSHMKYKEIKAIKASLYNMTNEEIFKVPHNYIEKLKDLASLINKLM